MKKKLAALALALVMLAALAACDNAPAPSGGETADDGAESSDSGVSASIALITMDQTDKHWVRLRDAAEKKVQEYNDAGNHLTMKYLAPETKDSARQIEMISSAVASGAEYIIIACNDTDACVKALEEAMDHGARILYVDSPASLEGAATFQTDNFEGGRQAGEYLLQILTADGVKEGAVGIVDAQSGVDSREERYQGFASVFENTAFVLEERQYSDGNAEKARKIANDLIAKGVIALYGTNDGATDGAASAVSDARDNGVNIYCVGWDNSDSNIAHIKSGELLALVAQNPQIMGEDAIEAVVQLAEGEDLGGKIVDTGVSVIDASNVAESEN